jgi:hypothetical protein
MPHLIVHERIKKAGIENYNKLILCCSTLVDKFVSKLIITK